MGSGIGLGAGKRPHPIGVIQPARDLLRRTQRHNGLRRKAQIVQAHGLRGIAPGEHFLGQNLGGQAEAHAARRFGQAQQMGAHVPIRGAHDGVDGLPAIGRPGVGNHLVLGKTAQGIEQALLVFTACEGDHETAPLHGLFEIKQQRASGNPVTETSLMAPRPNRFSKSSAVGWLMLTPAPLLGQ